MDEPRPDAAPARSRVFPALAAVVALGLATAFFLSDLPARWRAPAAPSVFHGRDIGSENWNAAFALSDMAGRSRTLDEFRGKIVLIAFGYTHCPDVCPTTLAKFAEVRRLLGADGGRVQALFVTIDPERDTAELLRAYVPAFDPSFIGLRGTEVQTDAITRALHANYQIVDNHGEILVDHTASTYILDARGRPRVVTPYDQPAGVLAEDVRALLREG